ncbi:hypothetical protein BC830DRAFT_1155299 [Chytriomyces sp. MP71]|nr:hypothetical protein BC830DRAFT_1155299 [Chytriomyces sp. MP71]
MSASLFNRSLRQRAGSSLTTKIMVTGQTRGTGQNNASPFIELLAVSTQSFCEVMIINVSDTAVPLIEADKNPSQMCRCGYSIIFPGRITKPCKRRAGLDHMNSTTLSNVGGRQLVASGAVLLAAVVVALAALVSLQMRRRRRVAPPLLMSGAERGANAAKGDDRATTQVATPPRLLRFHQAFRALPPSLDPYTGAEAGGDVEPVTEDGDSPSEKLDFELETSHSHFYPPQHPLPLPPPRRSPFHSVPLGVGLGIAF